MRMRAGPFSSLRYPCTFAELSRALRGTIQPYGDELKAQRRLVKWGAALRCEDEKGPWLLLALSFLGHGRLHLSHIGQPGRAPSPL